MSGAHGAEASGSGYRTAALRSQGAQCSGELWRRQGKQAWSLQGSCKQPVECSEWQGAGRAGELTEQIMEEMSGLTLGALGIAQSQPFPSDPPAALL